MSALIDIGEALQKVANPATNQKMTVRQRRRKRSPRRRAGGERGTIAGVRAVALFEAAKGLVVVTAGLGLLALIHRDAQQIAEDIVRHLHVNPAKHYPRIFVDAAAKLTDTRLWILSITAMTYASVRFAEAYGLWRQRVWAEWFAILTGAIYLPVELYELTVSVTPVRVTVLAVNLFVVGWLSWVRWRARGSDT